jgi:predicted amidophosphoribosyltransferase
MSSAPAARPNQGYCTNCGQQLEAGVNFCTACGAAVARKPDQISGKEHLGKAMAAALDGSRNEDAICEYRAAISVGLPPKDEVLARAGLADLLSREASDRFSTADELLRSSLIRESIENMEKALTLDREHHTDHFAGLQRSELWNLDVLYRMVAMEKASRSREADAIDYLRAKIASCDYQRTCPLLWVLYELADLYRSTGRNGAAELTLLRLVSSQHLHIFPGDSFDREMSVRKEAADRLQPIIQQRLETTGTPQAPVCTSCPDVIELNANFCTLCGAAVAKKSYTPGQEHLAKARIASLHSRAEEAIREFREALAVGLPAKDEVDARAGLATMLSRVAYTATASPDELLRSPLVRESIEQMEKALALDREQPTGHFVGPYRYELWNLDVSYALIAKDKAARGNAADAVEYLSAQASLCDYQLTCPLLHVLYELALLYHDSGNDQAAEATLLQLVFSQPVYVFGDEREAELRKDAANALEVVMKSQVRASMNI